MHSFAIEPSHRSRPPSASVDSFEVDDQFLPAVGTKRAVLDQSDRHTTPIAIQTGILQALRRRFRFSAPSDRKATPPADLVRGGSLRCSQSYVRRLDHFAETCNVIKQSTSGQS